MPKKMDLSDRYARGQRRPRRRTPSPGSPETLRAAIELPAPIATPSTGPVVTPAAPRGRIAPRPRAMPQANYSYVRTDLMRIGAVVAILLVIMAVLYFILR